MRKLALLLCIIPTLMWGQCDTVLISNASWTLVSVSSEELTGEGASNGHAIHCFDNDTTTFWHTQWQNAQPGFPHEIVINLGASYPVNGFSVRTRHNASSGKVDSYQVFVSNDGITWGNAQAAGNLLYQDVNGNAQFAAGYFGAVNAQYVKFVALTSATNNYYAVTAELRFYQDAGCGATGQNNQLITFPTIADKLTTDAPFVLSATSNSGLPISYEIVSGPASIAGNLLTLSGTAGTVIVKAKQVGDASYFPAENTRSFEVYDLSTYLPTVQTKMTATYPIQMPTLVAYPIYMNASIGLPQFNTIIAMEVEIGGNIIPATATNGYFLAWWTPTTYGPHQVIIRATASNGNEEADTITINVSNTIANTTAQTFNGDVINYTGPAESRWFYGSYELPQSIGAYDKIIANFSVTCPSVAGGCDDWDRLGYVEYKAPDGTWLELFRYLTPYGVACNHSIDVTDYASLLQGKIEIRMFIDTWGTGGWRLHLDFDYEAGTPSYLYSSIQELWHGDYSFGDPNNLQPLDTLTLSYPAGTANAKLRITSTGHGWGNNNTGNAAEFFDATHSFKKDGVSIYNHHVWTICNPNPDACTGQAGTWQYNRAGWCPGTIAKPATYNMTPYLSSQPFEFVYEFQPAYVDYCHPNNPSCVSGTTCNDCNAGYNPFYRVGAYLISYSNTPLSTKFGEPEEAKFNMEVYPNPTTTSFNVAVAQEIGSCVLELKTISGESVRTYFFNSTSELNASSISTDKLSGGIYFLVLKTKHQSTVNKIIVNK